MSDTESKEDFFSEFEESLGGMNSDQDAQASESDQMANGPTDLDALTNMETDQDVDYLEGDMMQEKEENIDSLLESVAASEIRTEPEDESEPKLDEKIETKSKSEVETKPKSEDEAKPKSELETEGPDDDPTSPKQNLDHETEMVSEDELPTENPKPQLDTEAVSDEELPAGIPNSLDMEDVSDDELPPVKKKKKHRRHSSEGDKKTKRSRRSKTRSKERKPRENSPKRRKSSKSSKSSHKSSVLPELDKYWRAVKDDPSDFTGWTYLLQYVDQESDVDAAREAYDAFLKHYPYCYGYWRKYADYEKKKGGKSKCLEVFSRGLKAIPLSVDLWLHYLNYCRTLYKDNESLLREQFEKAVDKCGLEFRSDRLWDFYIKWETELKNHRNVLNIYDKLLKIPIQGYKTHFEHFEDFVRKHAPNKILDNDEFFALRAEVFQKLKEKGVPIEPSAAPPGDEHENDEEQSPSYAEETSLMRDKIISSRKRVFKATAAEVSLRWSFEEGIKRPYFHVKPLERMQLDSWKKYLDFEINAGNVHRTVILFERCLIACALYEEFWFKYVKYLESIGDNDALIRNVYQRACLIHHPRNAQLALDWSCFEEKKGDVDCARKVLNHIEKSVPGLMIICLRRINLERRCGNLEGASKLYEYYLNNFKTRAAIVTLSTKYAKFCWKILGDGQRAFEILKSCFDKYPDELRVAHQLLTVAMAKNNFSVSECLGIFDKIIERETLDPQRKLVFAQRKLEFAEDFCQDIDKVVKAQNEYLSLMKQLKDSKKHHKADDKLDDKIAKGEASSQQAANVGNYSNQGYASGYSGTAPGYNSYSQASYSAPPNQYNSTDQMSNYQNWNYGQSNYGGSAQGWSGYNYYS